ncbi:hypothetical protein AB9D59_01800 [Blautia producta]|uniref:hypothetical protein n=1 Tax=Blautia producta TaxID=33035 RepID=UPI0004971171
MRESIMKIYQCLQESDLIQKERIESDKTAEQIAECLRQKENMTKEEIQNKLYELALIAEKNGFVAGFRYAVRLFKEC